MLLEIITPLFRMYFVHLTVILFQNSLILLLLTVYCCLILHVPATSASAMRACNEHAIPASWLTLPRVLVGRPQGCSISKNRESRRLGRTLSAHSFPESPRCCTLEYFHWPFIAQEFKRKCPLKLLIQDFPSARSHFGSLLMRFGDRSGWGH